MSNRVNFQKKYKISPPLIWKIQKNIFYICQYIMTLHANRVIPTGTVGLPGKYPAGDRYLKGRISPPLLGV